MHLAVDAGTGVGCLLLGKHREDEDVGPSMVIWAIYTSETHPRRSRLQLLQRLAQAHVRAGG